MPNTATTPSLHASSHSCAAARALGLRRLARRGSKRTNVCAVEYIASFCAQEAYARLTVANSVSAFWPCDSAARAASPKGKLKPVAREEDSCVVNMPSPVHRTPRH